MCLNAPNKPVVYTGLLPAAPSSCIRRLTRSSGKVTAIAYYVTQLHMIQVYQKLLKEWYVVFITMACGIMAK